MNQTLCSSLLTTAILIMLISFCNFFFAEAWSLIKLHNPTFSQNKRNLQVLYGLSKPSSIQNAKEIKMKQSKKKKLFQKSQERKKKRFRKARNIGKVISKSSSSSRYDLNEDEVTQSKKKRFQKAKNIVKVILSKRRRTQYFIERRRQKYLNVEIEEDIIDEVVKLIDESIDNSEEATIQFSFSSEESLVDKYAPVEQPKQDSFVKDQKNIVNSKDDSLLDLEIMEQEIHEKPEKEKIQIITNVHELRKAVLDDGIALQDLEFHVPSFQSISTPINKKQDKATSRSMKELQNDLPFDHEVISLIQHRFKSKSKPGSRDPSDKAHLALSLEGGGMRGAVSAGMASAIAVLGLSDTFDSIYGSSAGSVVGAYMISRQMCIDVYTQVLVTAKSKFVCKKRLASSLAAGLLDQAFEKSIFSKNLNPAMNISFVLDSIMSPEHGLRPLDLETFKLNNELQPLRIVTSCIRGGQMETHCLGSRNMDFFDVVHNETGAIIERATTMTDGSRHGLFACLETSMTVPAATGPPLPLLRHQDSKHNITSKCFDAFCYEPIPYRSAVKEGATHVLVLKSRPEGNPIGTKPGLFEKLFAPMYFDSNDMPQVSKYFENGGQQYIYVEDYLTLDEGKHAGKERVSVPPTKLLYGVENDDEAKSHIANRDQWKKAHLLPISVPSGTPELSNLSVDTTEVNEAVRNGFAAAFDLLAPSVGIELNSHLTGERVAELIFPSDVIGFDEVLKVPVTIAGDSIVSHGGDENKGLKRTASNSTTDERSFGSGNDNLSESTQHKATYRTSPCPKQDSSHLLKTLPGLDSGKMNSLSQGLYHHITNSE
jgi:predicted patatin/cPLA2 family phospholipase